MSDVTIDKGELASWAAEVETERAAASEATTSFFDAAKEQEAKATEARELAAKAEAEEYEEAASTAEIEEQNEEPAAKVIEEPKKPAPLPKWMKDRLAEQTAKQREAERLAAEAEARANVAQAELEAMRKRVASGESVTDPTKPATPGTDYVPRTEIEARAVELAKEREFNASADQAYYAGKAAYKDFDSALEPLTHMGAIQRRDFQEAALATGNAPDVLYALGTDPDKASQILGFLKSGQVAKATAEMTRISLAVEAQKTQAAKPKKTPVSQAPAPIKPVGGSALPVADLEKSDEALDAWLDGSLGSKGWGR